MQNKNGIMAIMVPLKSKDNFPLLSNPFILPNNTIAPQKLESLQNQIKVDFPTAHFKDNLAFDLVEKNTGTSFIFFHSLPPVQYWLGNRVKVAVIATGPLPRLRSFNLNGEDLSKAGVPMLPLEHHEYLFANHKKPHIIQITPEGKVHGISYGTFVTGKYLVKLLKQKYKRLNEVQSSK